MNNSNNNRDRSRNKQAGGGNRNGKNERSGRGGSSYDRDNRSRDRLNRDDRNGDNRSRDRLSRDDRNGDNRSRDRLNRDNRNGDNRSRDRLSRDDRNGDNRSRDRLNRDNRNGDNRSRDRLNRDNRNGDNRSHNSKNRRNEKLGRGREFGNRDNRSVYNRNNSSKNYDDVKSNSIISDDDNINNINNRQGDNRQSDSHYADVADNSVVINSQISNRKKKSIINMSFAEMKALCEQLGYPQFHASQIFDFIYKRNVLSFDDISPLPKSLREKLDEGYYIHNCSIKSVMTDETNTRKMLISLYDNKEIEAVILNKDERITFCLSSQVGCAYGCKFCATGTMGFKRNLSAEEILAQFLLLRHEAKSVNSIVFMGMGEPLANAKNVFAAIKEINNYKGFNLGIRHITISTVGEIGGIKSLIERDLDVRLALSLHSLKEDVRSSIMPINKKYPLKRLIPLLKRYASSGKRILTFEWVLIDGVNDTVNDAYRLVNLKRELPFKVNLIALNPVEGSIFKPSSKDNMKRFAKILTDNGITVVQRFKQGQKILAGCGQLAIKSDQKH